MNDLNTFIDTSRKYTEQSDRIPVIDRSAHVNVGIEIANRAAQQQQQPVPQQQQMPPIVPVAN